MPAVGDRVLASDQLTAIRSSDLSRSSTTTVSADTTLTLTFETVGTYVIEAHLAVFGDGGDFKCNWGSANLTGTRRQCIGPQAGTTDPTNTAMRANAPAALTSEVTYGTTALATGISVVREIFTVTTSAVGATLTLQWAQGSSSGNNTTLTAGSFIQARRV